jgi:hypothetical protein
MRDLKIAPRPIRFERKDSLASRLEALEEVGVYGRVANRLACKHSLWRIDQAIRHMGAEEKRRGTELGPNWLVRCLDENFIPLLPFRRRLRPDPFTLEQRRNRALTSEGRQFIQMVQRAIKELDFLQWMFLVHEAIESMEDEYYRRIIFHNPSRSNWFLCEKVYGVLSRNLLTTAMFSEYLDRVKKFKTNDET